MNYLQALIVGPYKHQLHRFCHSNWLANPQRFIFEHIIYTLFIKYWDRDETTDILHATFQNAFGFFC